MRCTGGCSNAQIWRRQLSTGIAIAFINLSPSMRDELCVSQSDLQPLNAASLLVGFSNIAAGLAEAIFLNALHSSEHFPTNQPGV